MEQLIEVEIGNITLAKEAMESASLLKKTKSMLSPSFRAFEKHQFEIPFVYEENGKYILYANFLEFIERVGKYSPNDKLKVVICDKPKDITFETNMYLLHLLRINRHPKSGIEMLVKIFKLVSSTICKYEERFKLNRRKIALISTVTEGFLRPLL